VLSGSLESPGRMRDDMFACETTAQPLTAVSDTWGLVDKKLFLMYRLIQLASRGLVY
jgi:hypothetical protein